MIYGKISCGNEGLNKFWKWFTNVHCILRIQTITFCRSQHHLYSNSYPVFKKSLKSSRFF